MTRADPHSDHVTPYDRFAWSDTDIEGLLVSGGHERELVAYFGESEYRELRRMARRGAATPLSRRAPRVYVVPGIMGSQLGLKRKPPLPHDIVWLDPIDIGLGRLACLRLGAGAPVVPLGAVLFSHLRLKLYLRARGFDTLLYDYDWRLGIDTLGAALAERLRAESHRRLMIVAHSMGGLVCRAALAASGVNAVERAVLLGTPNAGSFAPLQALRGTYSVVRRIARLVTDSTAESLAADIFNGFPSLYQMLPAGVCHAGDLFDPAAWPGTGPQPDQGLLARAREVRDSIASSDPRITAIAGVGEETVTAVARRRDDFVYTITRRGDGTVPAVSASLPGAGNYYTRTAHSDLTRDPLVAAAVVDVLKTGSTRRLASKWASRSAADARITDTQLRRMQTEKVDWARLQPDERRAYLETLNEPPRLRLKVRRRR